MTRDTSHFADSLPKERWLGRGGTNPQSCGLRQCKAYHQSLAILPSMPPLTLYQPIPTSIGVLRRQVISTLSASDQRQLWLFEMTISFESLVADARERKRAKYQDLVEAGRAAGYRTELITVEVGSRGMLCVSNLNDLRESIDAPKKEFTALCLQAISITILESFYIWGTRNYIT